jgi:hypothetical protein
MYGISVLAASIPVVPVLAGLAQGPQTRPSTVLEMILSVASTPPEMTLSVASTLPVTAALITLALLCRRARPPMLGRPPSIALAVLLEMPGVIVVVPPHRARASVLEMLPLIAVVALLETRVWVVVPWHEMEALTSLSPPVRLIPLTRRVHGGL